MASLADAVAAPAGDCAHCGLVVAPGDVVPGAPEQFCCAGCRTAYAILHAHGLEGYYALPERRGLRVAVPSRTYEEFDHRAFHDLYVQGLAGGLARVTFVLEGVHCASCVWLVERVPLVVSGVVRAELDVGRSRVTIEWNPAATPLSAIGRTLASLGYPPHPWQGGAREEVRRREDRAALVRIGVAGAIAINVMLAALAMYAGWFGAGLEREYERYFRWLSLALVVPAMLGPGRVFFRGAWAAVRTRTLHLDLPIAIALGAGFARGAINTITDRGPIYLDGIAVLIFLLLVGRYLQLRWQRAATDASELLYSLTPSGCTVIGAGDAEREVPAAGLVPGMLLAVRAGEVLAADGVVEAGESTLDQAWLTGESRPVAGRPGTVVFAGTLNLTAPLRVRVTQAGEATRVARVLRQVEEGARRRAPVVLLANRLAGAFVAATLGLAGVTTLAWWHRDAGVAMDNAIALLIVTCPCALAMATPLSVSVALGRSARQGIFVRGGDSLELLAGHGVLLLDKTGTITAGRSALVDWTGRDDVRPLVLGLEAGSRHVIADGFRRAWPDVAPARAGRSTHVHGGGVRGQVEGHEVVVGSPAFVSATLAAGASGLAAMAASRSSALTPVWVAVDGALVATARFGDPVRDDSARAIAGLRKRGWNVRMLSGDAESVCLAVGREVGLRPEDIVSEATPERKLAVVAESRARGPVVMVGDGVNDAAAIAAASVGVAVHGGAEAAMAASDAYLTTAGLAPIVSLVDGSRRTMRVIRRNIGFSLAYNAVGVTLAMTGTITPLVAAVMMPLSSLTVVAGAWFGRTFDPPDATGRTLLR